MNAVKSQPPDTFPLPSTTYVSGKLVIIGVVTVSLIGAVASWLFRYNATHRAAKFWGPEAAVLIRDAPHVTVKRRPLTGNFFANEVDVSHARGLVHLRNALLEDQDFDWYTV